MTFLLIRPAARDPAHAHWTQTFTWTISRDAGEHRATFWGGLSSFVAVFQASVQISGFVNVPPRLGRGPFRLCCTSCSRVDPQSVQKKSSASHPGLLSGADEVRFDHLSTLAINFTGFICLLEQKRESQRQKRSGEKNQFQPLPLKQAVSKSICERGTKARQEGPVAPSNPQETGWGASCHEH